MELQNKVQQILDFFASNPEVSPELRQKFECWLLEHADDASVSEALERMWNRDYPDESLEEIVAAMNRLDKSLDVAPRRRRAPYLSRIAVAACIAAVFALGMLASYFFFKPAQADREYVLSASADSPGYFTLPDGTTVWLNSGGRLEYSGELDGNIRSVALFGEGYFEVVKNPRRPFHVAMDGLNIEVLGTCFDARCYPDLDIQDVVLRSGSVKVGDAQGNTRTLRPGEKLDYDRADGQMTVESVNAERYCTWMKPRLVFSNVPLSDVMGTLERRFNVDVTMDSIVASKRVTITVKNETSDEIFDILCGITKTSYTVDGRNVTFRARR
jgi:fe2+-dicitrate sensor, membrane component